MSNTRGSIGAFEAVADTLPALIRITNLAKEIVWANRAWLTFKGLTLSQASHLDWLDGVHPHDQAELRPVLDGNFSRQAPFEAKYRLRHQSGAYRWIVHHGTPRFDASGAFEGFVTICTDVHDQTMADDEHAHFFDVASDILLTTDAHGYISKINDACERILGWTADEIRAIHFCDLVHPDDIEVSLALLQSLLRGEDVVDFENRYRHKDGSYRWLSWRSHYDAHSGLCYSCGVDVSERKAYQAALEDTIARFNLAMVATSEGLWDLDLRTHRINVSARYKDILGYSGDDAPATADAWGALVEPGDRAVARKALDDHLDGLTPDYSAVFRMKHRSGGWRTILSRGVAMRDAAGVPYRVVGVHADVTDQRKRENDLRQLKDQAESANRAKTDFLANMSHEIRTPMSAVIGAAHILSRGALPADKHAKVVDTLMQGARSLMELIDDLLDLSKIEAGALQLDLAPFDAREVVSEVLKTLEVNAANKGLELQQQNRCNCVTERMFVGDRARIRQILLNLCSNAVKFTHAGTVTVGIDCEPTDDPNIEELRFFVSDTGVGIPPDKLKAIFGKFEQGDSRLNRRYGGAGLGLAIAKSLTETMGGHITGHSEVDIGSTFSVRLPFERLSSPGGIPTASDDETPAAEHAAEHAVVLLVEDNEANIMVASHFLDDFGHDHDVAMTGEEALAKVTGGADYQVILMDIQMPGMDGLETTRRIRAFEREQGLAPRPIIAMTAHAMMTDRLEAGMDGYLTKPFDPEALRATLASHLRPLAAAQPEAD